MASGTSCALKLVAQPSMSVLSQHSASGSRRTSRERTVPVSVLKTTSAPEMLKKMPYFHLEWNFLAPETAGGDLQCSFSPKAANGTLERWPVESS